jgi:bifunctional UDP-N-acetylglucosamine pyrophosphorylase / glucosamine-1-phosphate N-acetyltransferase
VVPLEKIVVVVGHQAEKVQESVPFHRIAFAEQKEQKGTGHAVLCARDAVQSLEGFLLILNGDGPLLRPETLKSLLDGSERARGGSIVTTKLADPTGYGRIVRDAEGNIAAIVEQKSLNAAQLGIAEVNPGVYCFRARPFWEHIAQLEPNSLSNEYYLTDMVEILTKHGYPVTPLLVEDETELLGINTRADLAVADRILRQRKTRELMLAGVTMEMPESILIDVDVQVGIDSYIEPNVQLRGNTRIGSNCRIGTGTVLKNCEIEDGATILPYVVAEDSIIRFGAFVGPFARLRMHAEASHQAHIGNFVELKNTVLGRGSKASHLAYLGDSAIGTGVNIGAGTITCNYDGEKKNRTQILDGAFIGSNSTLVAPLTIGEGAYVGAGSTITKHVEADALALGRAQQVEKPEWAKRRREARKQS